ncbi:MAG: FHA domain-containing protein [Spirochaetaceae bacterium]|nr:MAG: FHA domain-containing protein [Spirochaetaceae bacterium]
MATRSSTQLLKPNIRLLVTKGEEQGRVYETNQYPFVIGRDEAADFQIKGDNNISRKHARVSLDEEGMVWIEDLNSTNGCFVNNVRIYESTMLTHGSTIIIGGTWLKFAIFTPGVSEKEQRFPGMGQETSTFFAETKKQEAILILDLHDSSVLANKFGDEVALMITESLNQIALPRFSKYGSDFSKGTGDGFLVTFKNPDDALAAAAEILESVKVRNKVKKTTVKIQIRLCLHYGQCSIEPNGDRHGNAVNIAFRTEGVQYRDLADKKNAIAQKQFPEFGRIFATEEFFQKMDTRTQKKFVFVGNFRLKGIGTPQAVYLYK